MDFCPTKLRHLKYQRIPIEFIYGIQIDLIQITFRHAHPVVDPIIKLISSKQLSLRISKKKKMLFLRNT